MSSRVPVAVAVQRFEQGGNWRWPEAKLETHQLLWGWGGTLTLRAEGRSWLAPPTLGFWVPAGVVAAVEGTAARVFRVVVDADAVAAEWAEVVPVAVSGFLRETIVRLDDPTLTDDQRARTVAVLFDALAPAPAPSAGDVGVDMPMPGDDRLRPIADALVANPADDRTLADWGRVVGAGARTLSRLFVAETGMTFAQWRVNARMRVALAALTQGCPAGDVARFVGYRNPSAFSQAFRRATGQTPRSVTGAPSHSFGRR